MGSLAIIMPVYEDVDAFSKLLFELASELGSKPYIVAVDDGSVHAPVDPEAIRAAGLHGAVLRLRRNVGHQRAISVGMAYVHEVLPSATCVVMDSDGEDMPSTIPRLLSALSGQDVDIAVAVRRSRIETLRFKVFYVLYRLAFKLLSGRVISFGNFMALKPGALHRLSSMPELGTHIAATVLVSKLRMAKCPLDRGPRYAGKSKLNFSGLVLHGFRAIMIFAEDVLVRVGILCASFAALSLVLVLITGSLKLLGAATPGWFSITLGILVVVLLQLGALTLITLMLTGAVRGASPVTLEYRQLIDTILRVDEEHSVGAH